MSFAKFTILKSNEAYQVQDHVEMIINLDHIVSVKPIKMAIPDQLVIEGYWLRLSNGKKYKAVTIPLELINILDESTSPIKYSQEHLLEDGLQ